MAHSNHIIFQVVGITAVGLLSACATQQKDVVLQEAGVSHELAQFRKEHFGQVKYDLFFSIPESRQEPVGGKAVIRLSLKEKLPIIIDFRGEASQVASVRLNDEQVPYEVKNEHFIIPADRSKVGENKIDIAFTPADQSLNRRDEFLYTLLVPDRARTAFPCFDQPDMKSLFTLTLEVPATWQAVTNGAIGKTDTLSVPDRKIISFKETEPLSTYLFAFTAGEFVRETYTREDREISIYHRETDPKKIAQCPEIASEVFDALTWLEEYTAVPYPFAKYDLIILPGFQFGGMEHTGATFYTDRRMFLNENPTLNEQLSRSALIAHETAHMWFGDYVTMKWFDDVWTKEVFANYFASQIVEPLYPNVNHALNFMQNYIPPAYSEDRTAGANPIKQDLDNLRNAGLVYGNIIYDKSPVVLEMLIKKMGKDAFRQGIREYLKTYAYGNATWEGLITILDKYTDDDLETWSHIWVNEKGMPEITASLVGDSLVVSQNDPFDRGLNWPQDLSFRIVPKNRDPEEISVSLGRNSNSFRKKLKRLPQEGSFIVPNIDGKGYGFFRLSEADAEACAAYLPVCKEELLRGSIQVTLYENLLNRTISPASYMEAMLKYLPEENNSLLFSAALGYIGNCQRLYQTDVAPLEKTLWQIVTTSSVPQHRLQAFRSYRSLAKSPESVAALYAIWKKEQAPAGCALSESDYISLSYSLALHLPEQADEIIAMQQSRITNSDRKREYAFISPSVSPHKEVRDSVFASLLIAENRRVEPWASAALANLNHSSRQEEAINYIRPALDILQEVQRTGDIFFPTAWTRALLSGHTSAEARAEVDAFFADHPDYPPMLANKIRQQADHLYRLKH
ncbi:M1 family aminopeptidase [uncultured Parabacteroides sp.]|uniref:M1 family metallopeptidase n=1 Tax=uncultured Parabacteroides sp. TaxID=512312 RepID=UPI00259AEE01|nr:M1 family aminopeptidase [uncultured Parabacteroides sp.]